MKAVDSTCEWILEMLADWDGVEARRMFGGHGVYCGDAMFIIVADGRAYLKVDDAMREELEAMGSGPFRATPKQTIRTFYEIPADIVDDEAQMHAWSRRAVAAAEQALAARQKRPRAKRRRN